MEISVKELARLIELNKKKAELEFRKTVLGADVETELKSITANASELRFRAKNAGIELVFPNQKRMDELAAVIGAFPAESLREGLKIRDGKAYSVLHERGIIVKKNFENRYEIAKLAMLLSRMSGEEREPFLEAVSGGSVDAPLRASSIDEDDRMRLARFLRRCGIVCRAEGKDIRPAEEPDELEIRMEISNRLVWVSEAAKWQLEENLKRINDLNSHIQLKNAERQIKRFSDAEEEQFADLQRRYLELLKQQDELLREFNEEERLAVKAAASR